MYSNIIMKHTKFKRHYLVKGKKKVARKRNKTTTVMTLHGSTPSYPFPPKLRTKLRMNVTFNASVGIGAVAGLGNPADWFFKLNSLNLMGPAINYPLGAPTAFANNTAAGLFNLLSSNGILVGSVAPYGRYFVTSSSIRLEIYNIGDVTNRPVELIILPLSLPSSELATYTANTIVTPTIAEQPFARSFTLPAILNDNARIFRHSISVNKLAGGKNIDQDDDSFTAVTAVDPLDLGIWQLRFGNMDGSVNARSLTVKAIVEYNVVFYDLNAVNSSVPA